MRNPMMWGLYITLFMYFVGLSAGGLIVASAGRLFGATRLKPIVRIAVLEATVAVMIAALLLLPDIGGPTAPGTCCATRTSPRRSSGTSPS